MSVFDGFKPFEQSRKIQSVVRMPQTSMLLSEYLTARFTYRTSFEWLEEIKYRRFMLNGIEIDCDCAVKNNDVIVYNFPEKAEPACDLNYQLLGLEDDFIVVAKSGNLPTHPAGRYYKNTLWYLLQQKFGACAPVNRLDRETSGVILFARNAAAAKNLSQNITQRKYQIIVHGLFPEQLDADGFIMADTDSAIRKKRKFSYSANNVSACETCRTIFKRLDFKNGLSLLEAELKTGRTHQIRATVSSLGYPVAGDKIYGVDEEIFLRFIDGKMLAEDTQKLLFDRQALHAVSLSFFHNGKEFKFTADFDLSVN